MFQDKVIIKELIRLVNQLQITDSHITFRDKQYAVTPENITSYLVSILYSECYALKETYQSGQDTRNINFQGNDDTFVEILSQNNNSIDRTEEGWIVKNIYPNEYAEIIKQTEIRIVPVFLY